MKKNRIFLNFLILILFTVFLSVTCKQNIGLGGTIDIERPDGQIIYPDAGGAPIRGSFVMKGTAKDDEGVKDVSVVFKNTETGWVSKQYSAGLSDVNNGSVIWTLSVNNEFTGRTRDGHPLVKEYPIPDGKYIATVTVTDITGRTTSFSREYDIDNTPPVFIVSRPLTTALGQDVSPISESYGAVFTVEGQAEDKNKIEDLTLKVENSTVSISKKFVGKNINEQMAEAVKDDHGSYTDELYLYNDNNPNQKIKAHLFLTDNARFYKGSEPEGTGNTSEWYYPRNNEIRSVLAKGYTADIINDYFAGKRGKAFSLKKSDRLLAALYDNTNAEGQDVKRILENSRIIIESGSSAKYSVFTLNPDKSPGFKVSNATNLPTEIPANTPDLDIPKPHPAYFQDGTPPALILDLIGNRDNTDLVENYSNLTSYHKSKIVINLYKCNEVSYTDSGSVKKLNLQPELSPAHSFKFEDLQAQDFVPQGTNPAVVDYGGSHKLTVSWQLPANFKEGHYLVKVEGKDTGGNDFVAYNNNNSAGGVYVANFKLIGDTLMISPEEPSGYINTDFTVRANVFNLSTNPKVRYKIGNQTDQAGESDTPLTLKAGSGTEYESASIQISSVSEGPHVVHFWATDDKGREVRAKKEFVKDTTPPVPEMTFPSENDDQMGTVRIMGTVSDDGAGVKAEGTKYIIGKKDSLPAYDSSDWKPMDKSGPGSWEFTYNLDNFSSSPSTYGTQAGSTSVYEIPVYILTEDKIGNKTVTTKTIRFDSDGNKPFMTILSPHQDQVLGGAIQIFGTGTTRLGGPGLVGEVYIQFSKNGKFDSQDDGTFGVSASGCDPDWYKNGKGQLILDTTSGGASWQITVNENGAFNNPSTDPNQQNWDIYFRVRALKRGGNPANDADWGPWTSRVKITVDKAYPTVGSPDPLQVVNTDGSDPINYVQDMWIKEGKKLIGSLYDEAGIKELTISSTELLGSVTYNLQRALSEGWISEDTAHAPNSSTGAKNYKLQIPLTIQESMKRKGNLSIKIKIFEDTPKALSSETTLRMRFDVTKPAVAGGKWTVKSANSFFTGGSFVTTSVPDNTKKELYRVLVDDKVYEIDSVTGTRVRLKNASSLTGNFNYGIVERPVMVYNDGSDYQITGIAADTVTGVKEVKATLKVSDTETSVTMTRYDNTNKITQERGDMVSFQGSLDTNTVKNGIGTLTITAEDYQGNKVSETIENIIVKNKPVEIKKLVFKTDLSGNNNYEQGEEYKIENFGSIDADTRDFSGIADVASSFTFKNPIKSELSVTLKGGYGTNARVSLHKEGTTSGTIGDEITFATDSISASGEYTVTLDLNGKLNIGDAEGKKLYLKVTDESVNTPWQAQADITVGLDVVDDLNPTGFIMPFFYNSDDSRITKPADLPLVSVVYDVETDAGVITKVKEPLGHIEISGISSINADPCVSGKVKLRGIAYDNIRLKKLELSGAGISTVSNEFTNGAWSTASPLKVVKNGLSNTGHYVEWEYEWTTGIPNLAQTVTLTVTDAADKTSGAGKTEPDEKTGTRKGDRGMILDSGDTAVKHQFIRLYQGEKSYLVQVDTVSADGKTVTWKDTNVPTDIEKYRLYDKNSNKTTFDVNIVPYITEIETSIKTLLGKDFMRTATGAYTVRAKTTPPPPEQPEYETVIVTGFNLQPATLSGNDSDIRLSKFKTALEGTTKKGKGLTAAQVTAGDNSKWNVTIKSDGNGYLTFIVNGVPSINNIDNNSAEYNKEASLIQANADNDRRIELWDFTQLWKNSAARYAQNAVYPSMVMKENTPQFAYVNNAGGYGLAEFWDGSAEIKIYSNWDLFTFSALALNSDNSRAALFDINVALRGTGNAPDTGGIMTNFFYKPPNTTPNGTSYFFRNYNVWMDGLYKAGVTAVLDRYQYPCIKMVGTDSLSHVFYSTYDALDDRIIFRYFKVGTNATLVGNNNSANAHKVHKDTETLNLYINKNELNQVTFNSTNWPSYNDSNNDNRRFNATGNYSGTTIQPQEFATGTGNGVYSAAAGVPVTTTGNIVNTARGILVYYSGTSLNYIYAKNDENTSWSTPVVLDTNCGGDYVSMIVDKDKHVHIAYQDSFGGDVKYIYIPEYSTPATRKMVKVDSYLAVGGKLTLTVHGNTPYIAYKGLGTVAKVAWYKANNGVPAVASLADGVNDNDKFTGAWESQIIPTRIVDSDSNRFNIGVGTDGRPVIGYSNNQSGSKGIEYLTRMPDLTD
ncbi:hypothetical protein [Treponema putidum]|uniref:Ig-like domain-containing protein n=1 Tax=Treponema putidum TaxID=221027 RepID=A0ABY5HY25_9SPIR|nr:hypothetical protein [Treponema putidum]UTY29812.1 hypothetical protein E4N76_13205 [Treponema putidum]